MTRDPRACRITRVTTFVVGMRWRNCVFAQVETDDIKRLLVGGTLDGELKFGIEFCDGRWLDGYLHCDRRVVQRCFLRFFH